MRKRWCVLALVMVVLSLGLMAGCKKKPTAVSLATDAAKSMGEKKSVACDMTMDLALQIGLSQSGIDMSIDMDMAMDMESKMMMDGSALYGNIDLRLKVMDEDEKMNMEIYAVEEDGETVAYTGMDDTWNRMAVDDGAMGGNSSQSFIEYFNMIKDEKLEAELLENTEEIKGHETYVLKADVTGDMLMEMGGAVFSEAFEELDIDTDDFKDSKIEGMFYIDKDEKVLRRVSFKMESFLEALFKGMGDFDGADIKISECHLVMEMTDYDSFDEITVPEEVKEAAADMSGDSLDLFDDDDGFVPYEGNDDEGNGSGDDNTVDIFGGRNDGGSDNDDDDDTAVMDADGNYIITDYEEAVKVTVAAPEKFEMSYASDGYIAFTDGDAVDITYSFENYMSAEEMEKYYTDTSYQESSEDYTDIKKSDVQTKNINGMEVTFVSIEYMYAEDYLCKDYYAWTKVADDTFLSVEVSTFDGEDTIGMRDEVIDFVFDVVKIGSDI